MGTAFSLLVGYVLGVLMGVLALYDDRKRD